MALFTSDVLITSDSDLIHYLSKFKKAYNAIGKGRFVVNYDKLPQLSRVCKKQKSLAVIINTMHSSETNTGKVGHWTVLLIERIPGKTGRCIFVDGLLSNYRSNQDLKKDIDNFCKYNDLYLDVWNVKTQRINSNYCGFEIVYFVWYFAHHGLKGVYKLKTLLKKYRLFGIENYILKRAYKLCTV